MFCTAYTPILINHSRLFFSKLTTIINLISVSPKRYTKLHYAQAIEIAHMVVTEERETGRVANQIGNLH